MVKQPYLPATNGGRWTVGREIEGEWVALTQDTRLFHSNHALLVLVALAIEPTEEHLDHYFPICGDKGRCPTLDLLELFSELGTKSGSHIGV
jgi:hypothetical protein